MDTQPDNVRVAVRVRPLIGSEKLQNCSEVVRYPRENQLVMGADRAFTFDAVYPASSAQDEVYSKSVRPLVEAFLDGYNATIFAYGQTGSGKTYSMGTASSADVPPDQLGIVPRVVRHMYRVMSERAAQASFVMRVVFLEIHNDDVIDLLAPPQDAAAEKRAAVQIRERDGAIVADGATQQRVASPEDMLTCLEQGSLVRQTGATLMNAVSSRSHAIFSVYLDQARVAGDDEDGAGEEQLHSKFHFVDLAGSERLKRTGAQGQRMREGISINSGLLALGNVISALADPVKRHVPFRDSKITRLLQDSLGGNSRTLMIACVSPADVNFEETLNTLKYANRAKNIQNKAVVNRDPQSERLEKMRLRIAELEAALGVSGGVGVGVGGGGGGGGGGAPPAAVERSPSIATRHHDLFEPSSEELEFLKEQNQTYESEVRRLLDNLKNARKQMSSISDTLIDVEQQRDSYRLRLQKVLDACGDEAREAAELEPSELDEVRDNVGVVQKLREQLQQAQLEHRQAEAEREELRKRLARAGVRVGVRRSGLFESLEVVPDEEEEEVEVEEEDGVGTEDADGDNDEEEEHEIQALSTLSQVKERQHKQHLTELQEESTRIESDISEKERLMRKLIETRSSAQAMREEYEAKIGRMEAQIAEVEQKRARAEAEHAPENKAKSPLQRQQQAAKYQRQLERLRRELKSAKEQGPSTGEAQVARLRAEIEQHKRDRVRLQRRITDASDKHRAFMKETQNKIKGLEKERRKDHLRLRDLQTKLDKTSAVLKRRNEEKTALSRQVQQQKDVAAAAARDKRQQRQQQQQQQPRRRAGPSRDTNLVDRLKSGFDSEVELGVKRLGLERRLEQLLQRRQVSRTSLAQAEQELRLPPEQRQLSEEGLDYWRDRAEACEEEVRMQDSRIAELRSELARAGQGAADPDGGLTGRSLFTRHRIGRMDHSRALILHLLRRLVEAEHAHEAGARELADLKENHEQVRRDLLAVTRSSLQVQQSATAQKLLAQMDEIDDHMRMKEEEAKSGGGGYGAKAFLSALNVSASGAGEDDTPEKAARRVMRGHFARKADRLSLSHVELQRLQQQQQRSRSPSPSPGSPRSPRSPGGSSVFQRLYPTQRSRSSNLEPPPESPESAGSPGSAGAHRRAQSHQAAVQRVAERRAKTASFERSAGKKQTVFDRLTDQEKYTGVYKKIAEGADQPADVPSAESLLAARRRARKRASGGSGKAVFDRLTDAKNFTGVAKRKKEDKEKRPRTMSLMEKDLNALSEEWKGAGGGAGKKEKKDKKKKKKKKKRKKKMPTKEEMAEARAKAQAEGRPDPFGADDAAEFPTGAAAFSPFLLMDEAVEDFPHKKKRDEEEEEEEESEEEGSDDDEESEEEEESEDDEESDAVSTTPIKKDVAESAVKSLDNLFGSREKRG